jgi:2'-5' RNA ligase
VKVEGPPDLIAIQHGIDNETARLGYAREDRPFSPHLTLGRVSRNATPNDVRKIGEALDQSKVGLLGVMRVEGVNLYSSDLRPSGAIYTCLYTAPLRRA